MTSSLKVVIPMAGLGTRLRPHTWSKPKQLVSVAGRTLIDHVLAMFSSLPDPQVVEYVFIVGYLGDQVPPYMQEHHPELRVHYVKQTEMKGQSHAIYMAREHLSGPLLVVFADTIIDADFAFLAQESAEGVIWVKPVPDPRRFGVAMVGEDGWVTQLIEKPSTMENNLALVGTYYFKDAEALLSAIDQQMHRDVHLEGEYYLADAINILLQRGFKMRTQPVNVWLDAGTLPTLLQTNAYLLAHGFDNSAQVTQNEDVVVIPPVFIHPGAKMHTSVIGPNVSVGARCHIQRSVITNTILEEAASVKGVVLRDSWVGYHAQINGGGSIINVGDQSTISLKS